MTMEIANASKRIESHSRAHANLLYK